jgi:benzoyl-CoA reductase/2-hydroxyglutaryl-CoA dehydratase subunit BcrC/BadD/HgdB
MTFYRLMAIIKVNFQIINYFIFGDGDIQEFDIRIDHESDSGRVGFLCPYTVEEIIHAGGFIPVRISPQYPTREFADAYLPANFCPYLRHVVDLGVKGAFREYMSVVVAHTCDGARRIYDILNTYVRGVDFIFLDIPKRTDQTAVFYFREQLLRMVQFFERRSGKSIRMEHIRGAIALYNENRELLERIYSLRGMAPFIMSSEEAAGILEINAMSSKERTTPLLRSIVESIERSDLHSVKFTDRKRVFVSGNLLDYKSYLGEIERAGGEVVGDDFCFGGRYYSGKVATGDDPLLELSKRYLSRIPCGRMEQYQERFDYIVGRVRLSNATGVIYLGLKFCDNFLTDYPLLKKRLDEEGIPSLFLESEYFPAGTGQLRTRVEAFIEMI